MLGVRSLGQADVDGQGVDAGMGGRHSGENRPSKRLGRDPTAKEFQDAMDSEDKFRATPEEIQRAFDEGHAVRCLFLVLSRCSPLRICSLYKHGV